MRSIIPAHMKWFPTFTCLCSVAGRSVHVDTLDNYRVNTLWVDVHRKRYLLFRCKASNDGHIYLAEYYGDTNSSAYEIVIGSWTNTK